MPTTAASVPPGSIRWIDDPGYWAVASHAAVARISADSAGFRSGDGILLSEIGTTYDAPPTMMHTDPPEHTAYRALVQPAFGRRRMMALEEAISGRVAPVAMSLSDGEVHDVVEELTVPLPIEVIIDLLGIADVADIARVRRWSDASIPDAVDMSDDDRMAAMGDMIEVLLTTAARRRTDPAEDVISELAHASITLDDGTDHRLDDTELAMFGVQLVVAGNETTRNALAGGLVTLAESPEQWDRLVADPSLVPSAVEEILRWTSPVVSFMRTTTADNELSPEVTARAGDPVLLMYGLANRDPAEFGPTANVFDVGRQPNHHLAFGFGTHFCLGAALARIEIGVTLRSLLAAGGRPELAGEVVRSPSVIIAGIESAPMRFRTAPGHREDGIS